MVKIEDFFFEENSVSELNDERYSHVEMLKRAIDAMANATYQSIYVIDYFHTAEQMKKLGYQFYIEHVPENEQAMLLEINSAGFKKFNEIPFEERDGFFISYDFHIEDGENRFLINHKMTPFAYADDGRLWLAMCVVSLSSHSEPGHIELRKKGASTYSRNTHSAPTRETSAYTLGTRSNCRSNC